MGNNFVILFPRWMEMEINLSRTLKANAPHNHLPCFLNRVYFLNALIQLRNDLILAEQIDHPHLKMPIYAIIFKV